MSRKSEKEAMDRLSKGVWSAGQDEHGRPMSFVTVPVNRKKGTTAGYDETHKQGVGKSLKETAQTLGELFGRKR